MDELHGLPKSRGPWPPAVDHHIAKLLQEGPPLIGEDGKEYRIVSATLKRNEYTKRWIRIELEGEDGEFVFIVESAKRHTR